MESTRWETAVKPVKLNVLLELWLSVLASSHLQVGFLNTGKVVALDVAYYSNAGNSVDLSLSVSTI